jgi:hypothetical protein
MTLCVFVNFQFDEPAPQTMSYKEVETIFKEKLNQIIE